MAILRAKLACSLAAIALTSLAGGTAELAAQERGTLHGTLFDQQSLQPLAGGRIVVGNGIAEAVSAADGSFALELPDGPITIRMEAPGFTTGVEQVTIEAGRTVFHQFAVLPMSATLGEVMILAARGRAPSDGSVELSGESSSHAETAADLLEHQVPGLSMSGRSGNIGVASQILIRGVSTITQSSAPAIYLDGVRIGQGNRTNEVFELLSDIPASQVSRIRVLRGSSSAAKYGDSANGVILIETY